MKTVIFYYSGTGNSLWSARLLAEGLADVSLHPMKKADVLATGDAEAVGFVFPVHVWGIPVPVVQFIEKLSLRPRVYLFALAVNAGQVSRTLIQLRGVLACIQWCPQESIQFGKKTPAYQRYHHPQVSLQDMLPHVVEH